MRVAVVGLGYVGVTTAATLAYIGHEVTGLDVDEVKIQALQSGHVPFYEPNLENLLGSARPVVFTTDPVVALAGAEVVLICVGTPPGPGGAPDMRQVHAAVETVGRHLNGSPVVVANKSTVPVGSGNWTLDLLERVNPGGVYRVVSNPEFLREGSAVADSLYPDRIVIGADDEDPIGVMTELYRPILEQSFQAPVFAPRPTGLSSVPLVVTSTVSGEMVKYAANAFLALKISFINEIAGLCEKVGADVSVVARGIGLDRRIGEAFLQAGVGWGGSCFGKDIQALITTGQEYEYAMPILQAAIQVNRSQRNRWVVQKLQEHLHILKGRTITLLGLAFKPGTDDLRDAPALDVARALIRRGARVQAHDPVAMERARTEWAGEGIEFIDTPEEGLVGADAAVLVTEWPEYTQLPWRDLAPLMRRRIVVDGRHALPAAELVAAGYVLVAPGRGVMRLPVIPAKALDAGAPAAD